MEPIFWEDDAPPVAESLNGNAIDIGFLGDSALLTVAKQSR
ncbi:hypothetical protein [Burkholderia ambifaria]|nr:hypothetical protein [Burkholderia ambifaria]